MLELAGNLGQYVVGTWAPQSRAGATEVVAAVAGSGTGYRLRLDTWNVLAVRGEFFSVRPQGSAVAEQLTGR